MKNEIIIYQNQDSSTKIEVRLEDETVWLNRHQLALLFNRDIKTVGKHIANALREELTDISVVANFATTASDGKVYNVEHYNLDMILPIGYQLKSNQGTARDLWLENDNSIEGKERNYDALRSRGYIGGMPRDNPNSEKIKTSTHYLLPYRQRN